MTNNEKMIIFLRLQKNVDRWRKEYGNAMMRLVIYESAPIFNKPVWDKKKLEEQVNHYLGKMVAGEEMLDDLKKEFGLGKILGE